MRSFNSTPIPQGPFPLLPLRGGALLPGSILTFSVGRPRSIALIESLPDTGPPPLIGIGVQRDAKTVAPGHADLHGIATLAEIVAIRRQAGAPLMVTVRGLRRIHIETMEAEDPFWMVTAADAVETGAGTDEARFRADALCDVLAELDPDGEGSLASAVADHRAQPAPGLLADRVAASVGLEFDRIVSTLLALDVPTRLSAVSRWAGEAVARHAVRQKIETEVRGAFDQQQRETILRQQLKAIKSELGESGGAEGAVENLRERLAAIDLPEDVRKSVDRELERLEAINPAQAEYMVARTYLECIADLPWDKSATVNDDIDAVAAQLAADHYGLEDVKQRILEHLAVLKLSGNPRGTILCLAGPPGTGKTSLARSVADATGRPFVRIALGGVRDEAAIRGHRRTYVGALPGRIIDGLRKAGAKNPVMLLDEIDKLGESYGGGSPESALLEVLDPEQNKFFTDHYVEQPFDLSEVLFVCTANFLGNMSAPLRDRLEIVHIEGYTQAEKLAIARGHLIPRQLVNHGLEEQAFTLSDDTVRGIIADYTREAGVRQLERELIRLFRASALAVAQGREGFDPSDLDRHLGKPRFHNTMAERDNPPGIATGLAWTPVGGDVLYIETSRMPGKGRLEITGQLGDVMKESARAALTYVRSNAVALKVDPAFLDAQDLHIHVPAGATPKDGPSAGVTMFTALTSLLTGRAVRAEVAMTGECSLRGRVLPVGGIKAKVLAAHRAGITHVILPAQNERDLEELPDEVRAALTFTLAADMSEVLAVALEDEPSISVPAPPTAPEPQSDAVA